MDNQIKTLPFSNEAEQSVIGSVLINPRCINDVKNLVSEDEFYIDANREIFGAMLDLSANGKQIDTVTLSDTLAASKVFSTQDELRGYLKVVATAVPSAQNAIDYAKIVHKNFMLREIISTCEEICNGAYGVGQDEGYIDILNDAQSKFLKLSDESGIHGFTHIRDALGTSYKRLHDLSTNPESFKGTATGYSGLDNILVGMSPGDLVIIGARPAMGKTSFAMNIATKVAKQTGKAVFIFSLEMSTEQLVNRMLSSEALIDSKKIRSGELNGEDFEKLATASSMLAKCQILIDDSSGASVSQIRSKLLNEIPKLKQNNIEIGLVVIDYLQLMQADRRSENRALEVGDISRGLKLLAKDLDVQIITCAQLSRGPESRTNKRPMMSDLRDSGAIEQDADIVIFLYREIYYPDVKDIEKVQNTAEVIVSKNRHGSTGTVEMGWLGQFTKFTTLEDRNQ